MSVRYYRELLSDRRRLTLFREAIFETVRPGDRVADVGAGLGTFGFFALQAGAGKAYGIEEDSIVEVAKAISKANDFEDRAVFLKGHSGSVELPERVDLLITEDFDPLFLGPYLETLVIDSRERFLKPGGRLMPASVRVFLAPVTAAALYSSIVLTRGRPRHLRGLDFTPLRELNVNNLHYCAVKPKNLLAEPERLFSRRLASLRREDLTLDRTLTFRIRGPGCIHGLAGWFDAQLSKGVRVSNGPSEAAPGWGQCFLPLEVPLKVRRGDTLDVRIRTGRWGYRLIWGWDVRLFGKSGGGRRRAPKAESSQSTFRGFPFSKERFRRRSPEFVPRLSKSGRAVRFLLERVDGRRSLEELAKDLDRRFPGLFGDRKADFRRVLDLVKDHLE